jgi:ketosteroid isomerase-like protein
VTPDTLPKLRAAYQQWHDTRGGSADAWMALMHDDIRMRSAADGGPGLEFSAARDGKAAAYHYFTGLAADWEMIHYTVEHLLVDGEHVAMFGRCAYRNRKTGKVAETDLANRWRFRDGLAVEFYELYDTAKAFAAAVPDPA